MTRSCALWLLGNSGKRGVAGAMFQGPPHWVKRNNFRHLGLYGELELHYLVYYF